MAEVAKPSELPVRRADKDSVWHTFWEVAVYFCVLVLLASEPVPGVNETHYLTKAKHAFDATFAPGDLFLESHDSHWLAAAVAGLLALIMPLTAVAWVGRFLSWICMALAWRHLQRSLQLPTAIGCFALASWFLAVHYGNWAGEWAIGGFEAKSLAYPCIVVALGELVQQRWNRVWLWLGLAVAWHPLVGGWAGLSVGLAWLSLPNLGNRVRTEAFALFSATCIGLIGALPAATGLSGPNRVGNVVASQIHVYFRLYHHQCPLRFDSQRHLAGAVSLGLLTLATIWWIHRRRAVVGGEQLAGGGTAGVASREVAATAAEWLLKLAWIAVGFALVGLLIDWGLSERRPDIASRLLRFYWFRWADVVVPLAWTLTFWTLNRRGWERAEKWLGIAGNRSDDGAGAPGRERNAGFAAAWLGLGVLMITALVARQSVLTFQKPYPAADQAVMDGPALREVSSDRFTDWLAVCQWVRENSPPDSLWFTPKHQQTFKWYAGRAEVVCWKDVPQDNASVREWFQRILDCDLPRASNATAGKQPTASEQYPIREWKSEELRELSRRYGFRWVLVDRQIQQRPLLQFEIMYPVESENRSFAVFRIPDDLESIQ